MSTAVLPTMTGQGWSILRTPQFQNRKHVSVSGKETVLGDWQYPRHQWELTYSTLRQGVFQAQTMTEFATLFGFYNARNGGFDSFLYQDQDDYQVTNQQIGVTDGVNTGFQAFRTFGGFTEPVFAIQAVTGLSVGGVALSAPYTFNPWGYTGTAGGPGYIFLPSVYPAGQAIVASFSFYWPCRFVEDSCEFEKFASGLYALKKLTFRSIK